MLYLLQAGGHVTVKYVVGGRNMSISEPLRLAADARYHVVRFTRHGANATLQLDDLPTQTRNYSGQLLRALGFVAIGLFCRKCDAVCRPILVRHSDRMLSL